MAAYPQYGGTNGVEELDLGQPGGTRYAAGDAKLTVTATMIAQETRVAENALPQQAIVFMDNLGPAGETWKWEGTLKVEDIAALIAIRNDLAAAMHGHTRTAGVLGPFVAARIKATTLTDSWGNVISTRARIADYKFVERVHKLSADPTFAYITRLAVWFKTLA